VINYFEDRSCYIIYLSPVYSWRLETHRNSSTKKKGLEELPSEKTGKHKILEVSKCYLVSMHLIL
jgi:hypothetical protein